MAGVKVMRYRQAEGVTAERSGERVVILDAAGATLITLNGTGAVVWSCLEEPCDERAIVTNLREMYPDVDTEQLRADVSAFIAELREADLIVACDADG